MQFVTCTNFFSAEFVKTVFLLHWRKKTDGKKRKTFSFSFDLTRQLTWNFYLLLLYFSSFVLFNQTKKRESGKKSKTRRKLTFTLEKFQVKCIWREGKSYAKKINDDNYKVQPYDTIDLTYLTNMQSNSRLPHVDILLSRASRHIQTKLYFPVQDKW